MSDKPAFKSVKITTDAYDKAARARAILIDQGGAALPVELHAAFLEATAEPGGRQRGVGLGVVMDFALTVLLRELDAKK